MEYHLASKTWERSKNERLSEIALELGTWFKKMDKTSLKASSQGWLEYLLVSWTGRPRPKAGSW